MIPIAEPCLGEEELNNAIQAIQGGRIISQGKLALEVENQFAQYCVLRCGISNSSRLDVLHPAPMIPRVGTGSLASVATLILTAIADSVSCCKYRAPFD